MNDSALPQLPLRSNESHKGDFGRVLIIGGSRGMSGAVSLSGMAALRSGAGLVTLAVPDVCLDVVASFTPEYMTIPIATDEQGRMRSTAASRLIELCSTADAVAIGPGLGRSSELEELVPAVLAAVDRPIVVDADGLNALAGKLSSSTLHRAATNNRIVLTPHPGEFRRLLGKDSASPDVLRERAPSFADEVGVVLLLKGHRTLITDGQRAVENTTGNAGMATGGTGDVLTGLIAGLLAQGMSSFEAAQLGAHVHGAAGDLAARELGQVSMIAGDVIQFLPQAFQSLP